MRIGVMGAGGVGGYFGGRLARAGENVVFIARGRHLEALRTTGLQVESPDGDFAIAPCRATDDPAAAGEMDAVLVGVKAWQVTEAARAMRPMVGERTVVLPLQNGVEAPAELVEILGSGPVLGGLCRIIAERIAPGRIRHGGGEPYVALGELDNRPSERVERLRQAFERAGVKAEIPPDIQAAMWEKLILIASISGVAAVTRAPLGTVRSLPQTRALLTRAMQEILTLAHARGIAVAPDVVERTLAIFDRLPADGTASMQRDIQQGRPSELESQNGAVVRLGRQAGIATPVHEILYASLLPQELKAREGRWRRRA